MASQPKNAGEWREAVRPILAGINRYNPEKIALLEDYVRFQSEEDVYDFEANLALMKLYQFHPQRVSDSLALHMLVHALAHLPHTHFLLLTAVLPVSLHRNEDVERVKELHALLESCEFKKFWELMEECGELVGSKRGFHAAIRNFICGVVQVSFQSVTINLLTEYLGDMDENMLSALVEGRGWRLEGDTCHIALQETQIKPKKILAKIEMDSVAEILASAATRRYKNTV